MKRSAKVWNDILIRCQVKPTTAALWSEVFAVCVNDDTFSSDEKDVRNFLGQTLHESMLLERLEENLNYSAQRLMKVWPSRFPNEAVAKQYAHQPEKLANYVYGGRLGNTKPGDGWMYRGSGLIMVTGLDNYKFLEGVCGLPLVRFPGQLRQPLPALQASIAWWERRVPDRVLDDVERVTEFVNGGHIGLEEREQLTVAATTAIDDLA